MTKSKKLINLALLLLTAIFLAVTLSIPNHGNGNGFDYDIWTTIYLYPFAYTVLGILLGLLLFPRSIFLNGAVLYVLTFLAFFIHYIAIDHTIPDLAPFSFACLIYPLLTMVAAFLIYGIRRLIFCLKDSYRILSEKKSGKKT